MRRTRLTDEIIRSVIAATLAFGVFTSIRQEEREPAQGVPSTFSKPKAPGGPDAVIAEEGGEVVEAKPRAAKAKEAVNDAKRAFLGFDTFSYPGDDAMKKWKAASPYEWVGYYLPAPCHKDDTWTGKRERLEQMGWGIAVVYVGQQVWSGIPKGGALTYITRTVTENGQTRQVQEARTTKPCAAAHISADRGKAEADDAIAKTAAEGFPEGTVIYLDIERVEVMPQRYRDYIRSWTDRVLEDGRFAVGAYVHTHNANDVFADMREISTKRGVSNDPHMWIAKGSGFHPAAIPEEVGHAFAAAWQGVLDVTRKYAGVKMPIDENVSDRPNPSAPVD